MKLYVYNNWHNGDVVTNRALIKELMKCPNVELAVGSYKDRHYIVKDLPVKHIVAHFDEDEGRTCLSLLCPRDYVPINGWCGTFPDIDKRGFHNWSTIVDTFNRQSDHYNLGIKLSSHEVPMIDFESVCNIKISGRGVYVENGQPRGSHSFYNFDMNELGHRFPEFTFYCTANPETSLINVRNCSNRNLVELSGISNQCEAIIGKGSGPFLCTYTEPNRQKPRAVMKHTAPKFWIYRNNPLKYLWSDGELYNFLTDVAKTPIEYI